MTRDPMAVEPGSSVDVVETPALLLDLDAFESNCRIHLRATCGSATWPGVPMPRATVRPRSRVARPHSVRSASPSGKVSEAEAMAENGIGSILVTTEQPTIGRWLRLASCRTSPR